MLKKQGNEAILNSTSLVMLIDRVIFRCVCGIGDRHLRTLKAPDTIERRINIPYGKHGKRNLLDVYYPKGTVKPLPAIVNMHGGGYVYGSKNHYQFYCMDLAQRGFTVINFNYRLVPKIAFPMPVIEANEVMKWVSANAAEYYIDTHNIFFVGDSAGAQIASQYAAIVTNPAYAALFDLTVPDFTLKALGLNCGMYEKFHEIETPLPGIFHDYFGKDPSQHGEKMHVFTYITGNYPPAFITSAVNDFLLPCARPMYEQLREKGIHCELQIYGSKEEKKIGHVFHLNFFTETARACNDAQCDFFRNSIT